jgi:predicted ribonuclease toxin of YeeF-YezG toxin-antitoxin module
MKAMEEQLAQLSMKVGTGEHAQSLLTAMTQSTTTNARDLANMQAAAVASYEIEKNTSPYLTYPKQCLQKFSEHCKAQKGKPLHTGHPKNYVMVGLVEALM